MRISWTEFKSFLDRGLSPQETIAEDDQIWLEAHDGLLYRKCKLHTESTEWADYVANYQINANKTHTDSDGIPLSRTKITESGWHYQVHGLEFTTSKLASEYNKKEDKTDLGYLSVSFFDDQDAELTTQGDLDTSCVKTVCCWEPTETFGIIGGTFHQATAPTSDVRMWVTLAPDIPVVAGGSVPFATGGINLKHLGDNVIFPIDGKAAKQVPYIPATGSSKFCIIVRHDAGYQCPLHLIFDIFRENT